MASSHLTTRTSRLPSPVLAGPLRLVPFVLLALTVVIGAVAGSSPQLGILLALGVLFLVVVTQDLALGVCGFLLLTFLDVLSSNSDLSLTKLGGAALAAAWLAALATQGGTRRELVAGAPWLAALLIAFLAWSGLSALWAESPGAAFSSTIRFGLNAMLVPIVYFAVRNQRHVVWIFGVFVVGTLLSVAWGLFDERTVGGATAAQTGRLVGARVEANVLATLLVVAVVFAGALALVLRRRPLGRALSLGAAVIGLVALLATFSRGGLVAMAAVLVVGVFYAGRWRPAVVAFTLVAVVIGAIYVGSASSGAAERLTSGGTSGRTDIWTVGWRMVEANPLVGVGSGNYRAAAPGYLLYPGTIRRDDFIIDVPYAAHNIYLHVLAEMGVVGLALFLAVMGLCIGAANRAVALFRRDGRRSLELMGRALVVAILGTLVADFFVSEQYNKQLWILLAMGPALLAIARGAPGHAAERA